MSGYIEGKRAVIEALRTDVPLTCVYMADNIKREPLINDILRKARQRAVEVKTVSRAELDKRAGKDTHQGVVAHARPFPYRGIGDIIAGALAYATEHDGRALVVVCDHLTDAGNFGALLRSAEAVGVAGVVIPNKRSARVEAATYKSSAGAVAHLPLAQTSNIPSTLERLKKDGFWVCACTEQASHELWDVDLKGKIALVVGNEHEGISPLVLQHCDMAGRLPMMGMVGSLNVAQAATACMYEWLRQNW